MMDLNPTPIISYTTSAVPTIIEIMQFLKKRIRLNIESDRPFVTADRDFLLETIFECCLVLRLCERSAMFKKILQAKSNSSNDSQTSFTFIHKFAIVNEIFTQSLHCTDISLTDFFQPDQKKMRGFFGMFMRYAGRYDFFMGQFTPKLAHFKLLEDEVQMKKAMYAAADRRLAQLELDKAAEKPFFDKIAEECKVLSTEITQLKADLKARKEAHLGVNFVLEEVSIKLDSKNRELAALKEKARDLTNQVVPDEQTLVDSKNRITEVLSSLTTELKEVEDKVQEVEARKAQMDKHLGVLEIAAEQIDQLVKKRATLATATNNSADAEARLSRMKRDIEELEQSLQHLHNLEQTESLNSEGFQVSFGDLQNKIENDIKAHEGQIRSTEEAVHELNEEQRELEGMLQSCQATIAKLLEQQAVVCGALEELFGQAKEKMEGYRRGVNGMLNTDEEN